MKNENVISFFPQIQGHGGIPRFNRNLIEAYPTDHKAYSLNDVTQGRHRGAKGNKLMFLLYFLWTLLQRPGVIVLGHLNFLPLALLAFVFRIKVVTVLHGIEAWHLSSSKRWFTKFCSYYWAVSDYTKHQFELKSGVPEGRTSRIFNTLPRDWQDPGENCTYETFFLSVTRLSKEEDYKGIMESLEAVAKIKSELIKNDWKYVVVAHGDDLDQHKLKSKELDLGEIVEFKEAIPDDEMKRLYRRCSFFLLPSSGEGFGIVYLEAMACKKACIGAENCGSSDAITNQQTGFLVPQDPETIADTILKLMNDPELVQELGNCGYEYLEHFRFEQFENRIKTLINAICVE